MNLPPPKPGYAKHLERLGDSIRDVEHFRGHYIPARPIKYPHGGSSVRGSWGVLDHTPQPMNVAVVILKDGACFIGEAKLNYRDTYNRKRGHEVAVGRALKAAVNDMKKSVEGADPPLPPDFYAPEDREGVDLRDFCRSQLDQLGVM